MADEKVVGRADVEAITPDERIAQLESVVKELQIKMVEKDLALRRQEQINQGLLFRLFEAQTILSNLLILGLDNDEVRRKINQLSIELLDLMELVLGANKEEKKA